LRDPRRVLALRQGSAEKILWATDHLHPDAKNPGVVEELMEAVKPLPDESQRQIVGATARSFYKL
jgi:hypothetical protein